jgi:peptidoglycan hydrolase-like protein with peptidoglycan-binding domain
MRSPQPRRRTQTSQRATGRLGVVSTISTLAIALALAIPSASVAAQAPVSAGWHGRAIQQPEPPGTAVTTTVVSLPAGWSAGSLRMGTGFDQPGGSQRVREVQRQLRRLGYRPGPVDGLFGAQTWAAVQWFQIKHGLTPDGVAGPGTLSLLRERTTRAPAPNPVRDDRRSGRAPQSPPAAAPADRSEKPAGQHGGGGGPAGLVALALLLLAVPVALAVTMLRRRRQEASKQRRPSHADQKVATGPVPQAHASANAARTNGAGTPASAAASPPRAERVSASPDRALAIGYVRSTHDRAELARHAGAIRRACERRGWALEELVHDERAGGVTFERPGLSAALERLSEPGPSRLVVSKLAHLSSSAADLTALFEWFAEHDVQMVATDVGLDTTTPEGRRAAHARLVAVEQRQARERESGRTRGHGEAKRELAAVAGRVGANDSGVSG